MYQHTIGHPITVKGKDATGSRVVRATLCPAPENTGIVFRRETESGVVLIPADLDHAGARNDQLVLSHGPHFIKNCSEFLATCFALGIHNLFVDLNGDGLPEMANNAAGYAFIIRSAGKQIQPAERKTVAFADPCLQRSKGGWIRTGGYDGLRVACINTLHENALSVQRSSTVVDVCEAIFLSELCHAAPSNRYADSGASVNAIAQRNQQRYQQRSQLNYMVIEVLSVFALANVDFVGVYTAFDADLDLHLETLDQLRRETEESTAHRARVNVR